MAEFDIGTDRVIIESEYGQKLLVLAQKIRKKPSNGYEITIWLVKRI